MDLKQYEQLKFELSAILRAAALRLKDPKKADGPRDLLSRLAEDRFNLVLVGRTSRGKSSLMNALLGTNRLPTGILPVTSVITAVGYGSKERAFIKHVGWSLDNEISLDALADYVSQQGNPANSRRVSSAHVELPCELLRRGFYLVDTPGLGSAFLESTKTTARFLPQADAYMLVTSYEAPLSEEELHLLRAIASSSRRVFVVINKRDTVCHTEWNGVETHVRHLLHLIFGENIPDVFSVSAREAVAGHGQSYAQSARNGGIEQLRESLVHFLLEDRQVEFLTSMCLCIGEVLHQLPGATEESRRIEQLRQGLSNKHEAPQEQPLELPGARAAPKFVDCVICKRIDKETYNFLCTYQYDAFASAEARTTLAEEGGLCEFHTWAYEEVASPRGTCIAFASVLERLEDRLRMAAGKQGRLAIADALQRIGAKSPGCAICQVRKETERTAIGDYVSSVLADRALRSFTGVCIPHLRLISNRVVDEDILRALVVGEADAAERVREDMQRYALKFDGIRRYLASEEETSADRRALVMLAGYRSVNAAKSVQ